MRFISMLVLFLLVTGDAGAAAFVKLGDIKADFKGSQIVCSTRKNNMYQCQDAKTKQITGMVRCTGKRIDNAKTVKLSELAEKNPECEYVQGSGDINWKQSSGMGKTEKCKGMQC